MGAFVIVIEDDKSVFPDGTMVKNPPASAGDVGLIPGLGRSSGEGHDNGLQYSCLENPMDRAAYWATVCGAAEESDSTEQLSTQADDNC